MLQCDPGLRDAFNILQNPLEAFQNPLSSRIGNLQTRGWELKDQLNLEIMNPGPKPADVTQAEWDARKQAMGELKDLFTDIFSNPSNFLNSKLGQFKSYTDFMSGSHGLTGCFPQNVLGGMGAGIAGGAILGTATFTSVIAVAGGAKPMAQNLCRVSSLPSIPLPTACEGSNNIFATILGAYNDVLDFTNNVLGAVTGFITQTASNLRALAGKLIQFVSSMTRAVRRELTKLTEGLTDQLRYALAQMLNGLAADPCTAAILQMICRPALAAALQVNTLPNFGPQMQIPPYL